MSVLWKIVLSLAVSLWSTVIVAKDAKERGLEIAKMLDKANEGFGSERSSLEMKLINAHGDEVSRKMNSKILEGKSDGDKSIITFELPTDLTGTRMLTWTHKKGDDDQWLFMPAAKRVKRISSRNKSGSFMGSEFSYEDLAGQEVDKFTYTFLEEVELDGRKQWKIERIPVNPASGYSKQVVWNDQGYMNPSKIEYYDRKGELLKTATFSGYKKYGKLWRAGQIAMVNHQTKKSSILSWSERELGVKVDEDVFDSENLEDF